MRIDSKTQIIINFLLLFKMNYRFKVDPVDVCPMNKTEFETAAKRMNCTGRSRYLCAPNSDLTNLIEFCAEKTRSLFPKGTYILSKQTKTKTNNFLTEQMSAICILLCLLVGRSDNLSAVGRSVDQMMSL